MNNYLIFRKAGEESLALDIELAKMRYNSVDIINQSMTFEQWYTLGKQQTEDLNRYEFIVTTNESYSESEFNDLPDEQGAINSQKRTGREDVERVVAYLIAADIADFHCGRCLNVEHMYSHPDKPGALIDALKALKPLARSLSIPYLCITRDLGNGEYKVKYHRLKD